MEELGLGEVRGTGRLMPMAAIYYAKLYKAMADLDADVYYQRSASFTTGVVATCCRLLNKPFVFGSSSIFNVTVNLKGWTYERGIFDTLHLSSAAYVYGLNRTSAIVAQTKQIASIFRQEFPRSDVRQIYPLAHSKIQSKLEKGSPFVLCISRFIWYRSPETFLSLAKMLPDLEFVLGGDGPMREQITKEARSIPNLRVVTPVTPSQSLELMQKASAYVNTSQVEGFPNTFLECMQTGTPYVSFYDPDEAICRYGLGSHVSSLEGMARSVRELMADEETAVRIRTRGMDYLDENHNPRIIGEMYENLFREKSKGVGRTRGVKPEVHSEPRAENRLSPQEAINLRVHPRVAW